MIQQSFTFVTMSVYCVTALCSYNVPCDVYVQDLPLTVSVPFQSMGHAEPQR